MSGAKTRPAAARSRPSSGRRPAPLSATASPTSSTSAWRPSRCRPEDSRRIRGSSVSPSQSSSIDRCAQLDRRRRRRRRTRGRPAWQCRVPAAHTPGFPVLHGAPPPGMPLSTRRRSRCRGRRRSPGPPRWRRRRASRRALPCVRLRTRRARPVVQLPPPVALVDAAVAVVVDAVAGLGRAACRARRRARRPGTGRGARGADARLAGAAADAAAGVAVVDLAVAVVVERRRTPRSWGCPRLALQVVPDRRRDRPSSPVRRQSPTPAVQVVPRPGNCSSACPSQSSSSPLQVSAVGMTLRHTDERRRPGTPCARRADAELSGAARAAAAGVAVVDRAVAVVVEAVAGLGRWATRRGSARRARCHSPMHTARPSARSRRRRRCRRLRDRRRSRRRRRRSRRPARCRFRRTASRAWRCTPCVVPSPPHTRTPVAAHAPTPDAARRADVREAVVGRPVAVVVADRRTAPARRGTPPRWRRCSPPVAPSRRRRCRRAPRSRAAYWPAVGGEERVARSPFTVCGRERDRAAVARDAAEQPRAECVGSMACRPVATGPRRATVKRSVSTLHAIVPKDDAVASVEPRQHLPRRHDRHAARLRRRDDGVGARRCRRCRCACWR